MHTGTSPPPPKHVVSAHSAYERSPSPVQYAACSLFNIVVDTDETASRILSIMNKKKVGGRVTFMPLNKLHVEEVKYPDTQVRP